MHNILKTTLCMLVCFAMVLSLTMQGAFAYSYENGTNVPVTDITIEAETDFVSYVDSTPESLDNMRYALSDGYPYIESYQYPGSSEPALYLELAPGDVVESYTYETNIDVAGYYRVLVEVRECTGAYRVVVNDDGYNSARVERAIKTTETNWKLKPYYNTGLLYFKEGRNTVRVEAAAGTTSFGSIRIVAPSVNIVETANMGKISLGIDGFVRASSTNADDGDFYATDKRETSNIILVTVPVQDHNWGQWVEWTFEAPVDGDYTFNFNGIASECLNEDETAYYESSFNGATYYGSYKAHIEINGEDMPSVGSPENHEPNLGTYSLKAGTHKIRFESDGYAYYQVKGMDITYVETNTMYLATKDASNKNGALDDSKLTNGGFRMDIATADPNYGDWLEWNVDLPIDGKYTFTLDHGGYVNTPNENQTINGVTYPGDSYAAHLDINGEDTPVINNGNVLDMCMGTFELEAGNYTIKFEKDCYARMVMYGINIIIEEAENVVYALEQGKTYKAVVDVNDYTLGVTNYNDAETGTTSAPINWTADEFTKLTAIVGVYTGNVLDKAYMSSTIADGKIEVSGIQTENGQTVKIHLMDMGNLRAVTKVVDY